MRVTAKDRILLIGYFTLPFIALTGGQIHIAQRTTFYVLVFLLSLFLLQNIWLRSLIVYFFLWVMYFIVCYFLGMTNNITVNLGLKFILYVFFAVYIVHLTANSKAPKEVFYKWICIAAICQALIAVGQMWQKDVFFWIYSFFIRLERGIGITEPCGTLGNPNFLATYLTVSLPFFFRRRWWYFTPVIFAIVLAAVQSTALIAMIAGTVYFFWNTEKIKSASLEETGALRLKRKRKEKAKRIGIVAALIPFAVYLCIFKKSLTVAFTWEHPRLQWWAAAIKQTCSNTLGFTFGMGPGAPWGGAFPMHNEWVTLFHHFGWIGVCIVAGYILSVKRTDKRVFTAFIILCIDAIGYYPFHLPTVGMLALLVIGMLERERLTFNNYQLAFNNRKEVEDFSNSRFKPLVNMEK